MHTFKPNESDAAYGAAKKIIEASKEDLAKWLAENRGLSLDTLKVGDAVHLEGIAMIEISSLTKFDDKALLLAEPTLHAKYTRELPVKKFKPLT